MIDFEPFRLIKIIIVVITFSPRAFMGFKDLRHTRIPDFFARKKAIGVLLVLQITDC